jgi:phosphinothricin acetyltransferase
MSEIRIARKKDAASMLDIYSPFILNTGITQETEVPSLKNFQQRISTTLEERPWLVCLIDDEIAGYAYAGKHRERKGYQWCTEPSVYVNQKFYRYGVANALYTALFDLLKLQGYVNAYAVITLPNDKSVSFHECFGFSYLTTFKNIGYKLGQWHDVGWWQKKINDVNLNTKPPIKFSELEKSLIKQILNKAELLIKNKT